METDTLFLKSSFTIIFYCYLYFFNPSHLINFGIIIALIGLTKLINLPCSVVQSIHGTVEDVVPENKLFENAGKKLKKINKCVCLCV